jgi:glycosyltransferase involved in cell wall biosynthesis
VSQKILIISPTPTHPQNAGNRARIFQLAEQLRSFKCDLCFAYYNIEGGDLEAMRAYWGHRMFLLSPNVPNRESNISNSKSVVPKGSQLGVNSMSVDKWYDSSIEDEILRLHSQWRFNAIWVEYVYLSKILDQFDNTVTKIIDTHDIFSDRKEVLIKGGITPQWFYTTRESERIGLSRAHFVIAIKESEAEFFRGLGLTKVITIGHLFPVQQSGAVFHKDKTLLYIASHNPINIKSWEYFMEMMLDLIKERIPDVSINVAGKICKNIPDSKFYKKLGVVDDLCSLYQSTMIAINPVTFGTGLKIKTVEPLAFGSPVVTTPAGIAGIEDAKDRGVLVGRTPEEFVGHIESLLTNQSFYKEQRRHARLYIEEYLRRNRRSLLMLLSYCRNRNL